MSGATTMNGRQRRRLDILRRRRQWLQTRIGQYTVPELASHDKAEEAALGWAIQVLEAAAHHGILNDLEAVT